MAIRLGSWGTPEFGFTERLTDLLRIPRNQQGGSQIRNIVPTTVNNYQNSAAYNPPQVQQTPYNVSTVRPAGQVAGASTGFNPSTGGQGSTQTSTTQSGAALTDEAYRQAAERIRSYEPLVEGAYNQGKGDIESAIAQAEQAGATQKQELESGYGQLLRGQLQTYQDLNRQRQGIFSNLGTLDSSAFGEQQFRGDQAYGEQRTQAEQGKVRDLNAVDTTVNQYKTQAQSSLSQLAMQYQSGKNALAQALASNDLEAAASIQDYITSIQSQAQSVSGAAQPAVSSIRGVTAQAYAPTALDQSFQSMYAPQQTQNPGQGYILPSGKKFQDYLSSLLGRG